jgi:hypothetical protein
LTYQENIPHPAPNLSAANILNLGLLPEPIAMLALIIASAIGQKITVSQVLVNWLKRKVILGFINGSALFDGFT